MFSSSLNMILKYMNTVTRMDVEKEEKNNKNYIQEKFTIFH